MSSLTKMMKPMFWTLVLCGWGLVCVAGVDWGDGERSKPERPAAAVRHAAGHVLVRFKPEAREVVAALAARLGLPAGAALRELPVAQLIRRQGRKVAGVAAAAAKDVDFDRFLYLDLPPGLTVEETVRRLENHPLLEYVEPDFIGTAAETIPDDPNFGDQWHHRNAHRATASMQTPLAWDITRGSADVVVAVLDSGLADLPEFSGRVVPGYNFVWENDDTLDDTGHGTLITGVLAAGVCALLAALRPDITQDEASLLLIAGAEDAIGDPGEDIPGFDNYHGWGRLNAFHTLLLATTRVDLVRRHDGAVELFWTSPANAGGKRPYRVEYASSLAGPWISLTNLDAFRYEANRTYWTDDGTQTGGMDGARFYRVGVRAF